MTRASSPRDIRVPADAVAAGVAQLDFALSTAQSEQLARFAALLLKWNVVHNLTAIDRPDEVVPLHLLDSLAIVPQLDRFAGTRQLRVLDVGSGGGLPGIPLAIARPQWHISLIDKVQKKTAFLQQASVELRLANVQVIQARVEAWRPAALFDVVVARAVASLADLVTWTRHLLAPGGAWFAMKGADPGAEIAGLPGDVRLQRKVKLHVPLLDAQRHLIILQAC